MSSDLTFQGINMPYASLPSDISAQKEGAPSLHGPAPGSQRCRLEQAAGREPVNRCWALT